MNTMQTKQTLNKGLLLAGLLLALAVPAQAILAVAGADSGSEITILRGQSDILSTPWKVARVAVTDPTISRIFRY
jgi:hypothetical protein